MKSTPPKKLTPMRAIRAKCLACCCDQQAEVRRCEIKYCPLWPYRMGHRPKPATIADTSGERE